MTTNVPKYSLHVVYGPTASGKTSYAIELAKRINGVLINADSRQIYKYLDIGTNKGNLSLNSAFKIQNFNQQQGTDSGGFENKRQETRDKDAGQQSITENLQPRTYDLEQTTEGRPLTAVSQKPDSPEPAAKSYPIYEIENSGILIYLIGFLNPDQQFSAFEYRNLVYQLIPQLVAQGKVPILVGGTGLYISAVADRNFLNSIEDRDEELRAELDSLSVAELQEKLQKLSESEYRSLNESDRANPRRLIRRIEKLMTPATTIQEKASLELEIKWHNCGSRIPDQESKSGILNTRSCLEELTSKINSRVVQMFDQGLVAETQQVLDMGFPKSSIALQGIGYRQVLSYLSGEVSLEECVRLVQIAHRQYAKRQITWFKKYIPS